MLRKNLILDLIFSIPILFILYFSIVFSLDYYSLIITILSFYVVISAYFKQGFYSFSFLFSVSFVLFNSSRYILDFFNYIDVRDISFFAHYTISYIDYEIQSILLILFIFCLIIFISIERREVKPFLYLDLNKYQKFILISLFLLSLASQIYKVNFLLTFSRDVGYISFQGNYSKYISQVPSFVRLLSYFFTISYFFLVISVKLSERGYKFISLIYLAVFAYTTTLGGRALFFTSLFVVIWLYGRLYGKRSVSFKSFISISLVLLFILGLGQLIVAERMGDDASINAMMVVPLILYDQGTTITVFSLVQKAYSTVSDFNVMTDHILRYFYMPFSGLLNFFGLDFKFGSFVEVVARRIDPSAFEEGYGLGGSMMAELYLYFWWFSVFFFYLVLLFYKKISEFENVNYFFVLIPMTMQGVFFSPRAYVFEFIIEVGRNLIYVLMLIFLLWVIRYVTTINRSYNI